MDERRVAWPCAEESVGQKRRGKHGGIGWLFEVEVARQRRGVVAADNTAVRHQPTSVRLRRGVSCRASGRTGEGRRG
jgi:hypothetical protein